MSVKSQERLGNEGKNGLQIFELSEKRKLSYILNSHLIQVRKPNLVIINKELSVNRRHCSRWSYNKNKTEKLPKNWNNWWNIRITVLPIFALGDEMVDKNIMKRLYGWKIRGLVPKKKKKTDGNITKIIKNYELQFWSNEPQPLPASFPGLVMWVNLKHAEAIIQYRRQEFVVSLNK